MSMPGGFLSGAQDRLLPASVPFRFFLAASGFHVAAWVVLVFGANQLAEFRGGPGLVLAAIHLATLGVFAMTAIGASYQLLPVVTRRPLARDWPARLSFWLMFFGTLALTWGMAFAHPTAMNAGADLVALGLLVFAILTADNLRRTGGIPVVSAHGWLALISLVVLVLLGALLVRDFETGFLDDHDGLALLHMVVAGFGFMGVLAIGLSLVLIPMFVLSRSLPVWPGWGQAGLSACALVLFAVAVLNNLPALVWLALVAGFGAVGCYLWQMRTALKTSMRKRLGVPFVLMRLSWGMLVLTLIFAALTFADIGIPNDASLTGFTLIVGWLLTFLTGVLQRIMPFLASMHAAGKSGMPPLLSELTAEGPLKVHAGCHTSALVICICGIVMDMTPLVQIGAAIGGLGAVAFLAFAVNVTLKLTKRNAGA